MIETRNVETILKEGKPIFSGKTTAKNYRAWLFGRLQKASKEGNMEMEYIIKGFLNAYNHYEPEKKIEVKVDSWHGHSSFEIIKDVDKLTIIKYQKKSKGEEATEVRTEVSKEELNGLIKALYRADISRLVTPSNIAPEKDIKTRDLAYCYCIEMGLLNTISGKDFWINFFGNRTLHNKFTLMLGALDKLGFIEYKGGKTKLLNKDISIQLIL